MTAVGLIGHGAIGSVVAAALARGDVQGCVLGGVLARSATAVPEAARDIDDLVARCDLVVEAAGGAALVAHGPAVVAAAWTCWS